MTTPNKDLPELVANQSQPHVPVNETFRILDVLVQCTALDFVAAPPSPVLDGDVYIVTIGTGEFAEHDDDFAFYSGGWHFATPAPGWEAWVQAAAAKYRYGATSPAEWAVVTEGGEPTSGGGGTSLTVEDSTSPPGTATDVTTLIFTGPVTVSEVTGGVALVTIEESSGGGGAPDVNFANLTRSIRFAQADGNTASYTSGFDNVGSLPLAGVSASITNPSAAPATSLHGSMVKSRVLSSAAINTNAALYRDSTTTAGVYRSISGGTGAGFDLFWRVAFSAVRSDQRLAVGIFATTPPSASSDPSALVNFIAFAADQGDTNVSLMSNDGSGTATKTSLGSLGKTSLAGKIIEVSIHVPAGGASFDYSILVRDGSAALTGTVSTNMPAADVALFPAALANTGGATSTAVSFDFNRVVLASDV